MACTVRPADRPRPDPLQAMSVYNLDIEPLPEATTPLEAVVVIKVLDADGEVSLWVRTTAGLNGWERLGMLEIAAHSAKCALQGGFEPDEGDK